MEKRYEYKITYTRARCCEPNVKYTTGRDDTEAVDSINYMMSKIQHIKSKVIMIERYCPYGKTWSVLPLDHFHDLITDPTSYS